MWVCLVFSVWKSKCEYPTTEQFHTYLQAPPKSLVEKNTILQRAAVAGLWKLWRHPQFYRDKGSVFLCYQVHSCVNEEPQLIYRLICCMLFDCMLFPLEVFVVVVGLELNLNKLYGLWKFSCTDHQLTETAHYVQSQGR